MSDWMDIDAQRVIKSRLTDYLVKGGQVPEVFAAMGALHPWIETLANYLYLSESIEAAQGIELERFGEYLGINREGMNDQAYRQKILSQRQRQRFSGTPEQLISTIENQIGTKEVILTERKSAAVNLHMTDAVNLSADLNHYLDQVAVAGVNTSITFGLGQQSFFFAGIQRVRYAIGMAGNLLLGVGEDRALGVSGTDPFAFNNLSGTLVNPTLLAAFPKPLVNYAVGIQSQSMKAQQWIEFSGEVSVPPRATLAELQVTHGRGTLRIAKVRVEDLASSTLLLVSDFENSTAGWSYSQKGNDDDIHWVSADWNYAPHSPKFGVISGQRLKIQAKLWSDQDQEVGLRFRFDNAGMINHALGVNGKALELHKFSPKSSIAYDGIRLAGIY